MNMSIKKSIENIINKHNYNGAVLLSLSDGTDVFVSNGFADIDNQIPITENTVFRIASLSKQYTATAILKLIEMKLLSLDDKLSLFIPDFIDGDKITIHHILSSCSGIPNFELYGDYSKQLSSEYPLLELINLFKSGPLNFTPGEKFEYSNSGYLVLTYIIEKVTALTFGEFLKKYIFEPIGIKSTELDFNIRAIEHKAKCYDIDENNIIPCKDVDLRIAGGGGALCSTLKDVLRFHIALKDNTIISKENYNLMLKKHTFAANNDYYCYGVCRGHNDYGEYLYHAGGGPGVRSMYYEFPQKNILFFIVTNVNDSAKHAVVFSEIRQLLNEY